MDTAPKVCTLVFLIATVLSIGLKLTPAELLSVLKNRRWMTRALLLNFLLVPALGLLLARIVPMSDEIRVGFLLLAAAPGGLNALQFTTKAKGVLPYAASLIFVLTLLSVIISPFLAALMLRIDTRITLPWGRVFGMLLLYVLVPLTLGLAIRHRFARVASRLAKPIALIGTVSFVVAVVLLLSRRSEAMKALTGAELLAMLGLILGGPQRHTRDVLATATSMRNAALCLLIALNRFEDTAAVVAVVAFSGLMIFPNMIFTVYGVIRSRKEQA